MYSLKCHFTASRAWPTHGDAKVLKSLANPALVSCLKQLKREAQQSLSQYYRISQKLLKPRLRTRVNQGRGEGALWVGLNAILLERLGTARQSRVGVRAGRHLAKGAFIATMPNGHRGVFKRKGRARLPLIKPKVELAGAEDKLSELAERKGMALMSREMLRNVDDLFK